MSKNNKSVYVSIDIEADGPIPGRNSMLSLGAAAFQTSPEGIEVERRPIEGGTFEVNIKPLPDACPDPDTMEWWATQPEAWAHVKSDQRPATEAMKAFVAWLKGLPGKPTFVGYPATYDFLFTYWYTVRFTGFPAPFGFQGLDLKTMAATMLNIPFRSVSKRRMPKHWFYGCPPHTHKALDDAIGQGVLFMNMLSDLRHGR